jgi:ATP-dependent Clp protease ATP-binding subunit ClpC
VYIQEQIRAKKSVEELTQGIKTKLTSYFKPELLNRFSDIMVFRPLSLEHIIEIARFKLGALAKTVMEAQGVDVTFDESAVHKIAELGYDQAFGARPIARAIDDHIKAVLSKMILSQKAVRGETFRVEIRGGEFVFEEIEKQ